MKSRVGKRVGVLVKLKTIYQKLISLDDSPEKIAKGFALGTFVGMTPFVGFQALIAVCIARILKWNRFAAGLAVFQTNVFTGAFVFAFNYAIGATLLGVREYSSLLSDPGWFELSFIFGSGSLVLYSFLLGGVITGIPSALVAYWCVLYFVRKRHAHLKTSKTQNHENKSKTDCLNNGCQSGTWEGICCRTCQARI